jgi:hypothetical protein
MPDYRALAQALDPYAIDTGGMTPDAIKMFQSGYKLPNFLGMSASQPTPQEIERMVAEQSPAFGVFPQMKPYRSQQDITASANVPVDLLRGRVAGTRGLFGDVVNQPIPMVRPLQLLSQAVTGQQKYPDTEHYLETMPLKSNTPIGDVAGRIGSFAPINPMPAVRAGQKGLNLLGMEVADRLATGQSVLPSLLKEPQSAMFAVNPADQMAQAVTKAEVSPLGFYSAVEQQALKIPRKQGTGDSFLNDLMKGQDVKKYEIEAMGLENYLRGKPNVTRQEVQDFIANNKLNVQERQLGENITEDPIGIAKRKAVFDKYEPQIQALDQEMRQHETDLINAKNLANKNYMEANAALNMPGNPQPIPTKQDWERYNLAKEELERVNAIPFNLKEFRQRSDALHDARDAEANAAYVVPEPTPTKYDKYQLPGGENYRELLLTLPNKPMDAGMAAENYYTQFVKRGGEPEWAQLNPAKQQEITNAMPTQARNASAAPEYRSSHFNEPNILAHMRVNDRVDAEGKKMLLIEEVQSDWHQAGREKGYKGKGTLTELPDNYFVQELKTIDGDTMYVVRDNSNPSVIINKDYNRQSAINGVINELNATSAGGVPDAPFKDTWHQLALKRAIKEAVDKGYDRIGLTTGAQQAERYKLTNEVDEINVIGRIDARTGEKSRQVALDLKSGGSYKLGVNNEGIIDNVNMLEINNLQGKKLADVVGKEVAKKIMESNSQTIKGEGLNIGGEGMKKYYDEVYPNYLNKLGKKYGSQVGETRIKTGRGVPGGEPVRYLDITPEMRKAIKEGQPLASIEEELAKALA